MSHLLYYFFLCLSLHASSALHIGFTDKETAEEFRLFGKDVEKVKLHKTLISSSTSPCFSKGTLTEERVNIGKNDETRVFHESWGGAKNMQQKDKKAPRKEKEDTKEMRFAGDEIIASPSQEFLQVATKIEGWKRLGRRMLGYPPPNDPKEKVDYEEKVVEDLVVMDYAQPHRKPPIHNKKH